MTSRRLIYLALPFVAAVMFPPLAAAPAAPVADSAVLLIGDGMGPVQVQLARTDDEPLTMEQFPFSGLATTKPADGPITDSAAGGTALATGCKTNNGMVSVNPEGRRLETILERARSMYKATGIITTDALHGATPASFIAHVDDRGKRAGIAAQIAAAPADVMLGFWKGEFLPKSSGGKREDGRDLIAELEGKGFEVVYTRDQLLQAKGQKLLGLFDDGPEAPSVADMVSAALARLSANPRGFFLVVEGARIDWECHEHQLAAALTEVRELDKAVGIAADAARSRGRTLVVVTADHETGGLQPDGSFTTSGHTAAPVPVFALGPGGKRFCGDLDNTDIPKRIAEVLQIGLSPD